MSERLESVRESRKTRILSSEAILLLLLGCVLMAGFILILFWTERAETKLQNLQQRQETLQSRWETLQKTGKLQPPKTEGLPDESERDKDRQSEQIQTEDVFETQINSFEKTPDTYAEEDTPSQIPEDQIQVSLSELQDRTSSRYLELPTANGEEWSVYIQELSSGAVCSISADRKMQSASVIKLFIMSAIYELVCEPEADYAIQIEEQYEGELKELLYQMITVSDNDAANILVERLGQGSFEAGAEKINEYCLRNGYSQTHLGRKFMEEAPEDENYTSALDCGNLLASMYQGTCVSPSASEKMLNMLRDQTKTEKIPAGLPKQAGWANKTGEMPEGYGLGCIENDVAIVFGEKNDYILCVLADHLKGNNSDARERIREISAEVYEYIH